MPALRISALFPFAAACLLWPAVAQADGSTFRNNLLPGHLTVHRIERETTRKARRDGKSEKLTYTQTATWTQCNLSESSPNKMTVYQMMVDGPPRIRSVVRGKKKVKPTPEPSTYGLPGPSTRLVSEIKTPRDAPVQAPNSLPVEKSILRALMDFSHWPSKAISPGHKWERAIDDGGFRGRQTFEFVDVQKGKLGSVARLTLFVEGEFKGFLADDWRFGKGQAILYWSRMDRTLVKMEARAEFARKRPTGDEAYELKLNVEATEMTTLGDERIEHELKQLTVFAQALELLRSGEASAARAACTRFLDTWPQSLWRPAVEELLDQTRMPKVAVPVLTAKDVKNLLTRAFVSWEAARTSGDYDMLDQTRAGLETLVAQQRTRVRAMLKDEDADARAPAAFALAFSGNAEDLRLAQKAARDNSPRVRAAALAGLAGRGSPETSVEMLLLVLEDDEPTVRARACQAIVTCVPREHYAIAQVADRLTHVMINDDNTAVRRQAIRALAAIGAPTDIAAMEKALTHELDKTNRRELEKAIKKLQERA